MSKHFFQTTTGSKHFSLYLPQRQTFFFKKRPSPPSCYLMVRPLWMEDKILWTRDEVWLKSTWVSEANEFAFLPKPQRESIKFYLPQITMTWHIFPTRKFIPPSAHNKQQVNNTSEFLRPWGYPYTSSSLWLTVMTPQQEQELPPLHYIRYIDPRAYCQWEIYSPL